jgi:hypothetical protein
VNKNILITDLPEICRNGAMFIDLINTLCGREAPIKGVFRNAKN